MKSKTWSLFLSLVMMALMLPALQLRARAEEFEFNGLRYVYSSDYSSVYVVGYGEGLSADLIIPEEIEVDGTTYPISYIGSNAFENCTSLKSVTIPSSVKKIGEKAFYIRGNLKLIFAPNSNLTEANGIFNRYLTDVFVFEGDYEGFCNLFRNVNIVKYSLSAVSNNGSEITVSYVAAIYGQIKSVTLKLVEPANLYYDKGPKEAMFDGIEKFKNLIGCKEDLKVDYYKNGILLTSAPVEPGKYDAVVTYDVARASVTFEIKEGVVIGDFVYTLNKDFTAYLCSYTGNLERNSPNGVVEIPEIVSYLGSRYRITKICDGAFYNCRFLQDLKVQRYVSYISDTAFKGCKNLKKVMIAPNSALASNNVDCYLGKGMFDDTVAKIVEVCVHENSVGSNKVRERFKDVNKIDYKVHEFDFKDAGCKSSGVGSCNDGDNCCGVFEYNPLGHICVTKWSEDGKHIDKCIREGCEDKLEKVDFKENWENNVYMRICSKCEQCGVIILNGPGNVFYDGNPKKASWIFQDGDKKILLNNGIEEKNLKIDYYRVVNNGQGENDSFEKIEYAPIDVGKYEARLQIKEGCELRVGFEIKCDHSKSKTVSTCTKSVECSICGENSDAIGHDWGELKSDDKFHWLECTHDGCSARKNEAVHVYSDWRHLNQEASTRECTVCKRMEVCTHENGKWEALGDGVEFNCEKCRKYMLCLHEKGQFKWVCLDDGSRKKMCTNCGLTMNSCDHKRYKWKNDDTYHWKECSNCDGQISEIHDFDMSGSGKVDVRCKVCGYKLSVLGSCEDMYGITYELQSNGEAHMKKQDCARETIIIPEEVYDSVGQAYKVTKICGNALKFQNDVIKTVIISKNVNFIDEYAFAGCRGLKKLVFLSGSAFSKESSKQLSWKTFWHCNANVKVSFYEAANDVIKNMFSRAIGKNGSKLEFHSDYELKKPTCFYDGTLKCSNEEICIPRLPHEWKIEKQTAISTVYRCLYCKKDFTVNTHKNSNGGLFNTNLMNCLSPVGRDSVIERGSTVEVKVEEKSASQVEGAIKTAVYFDITFTCGDGSKITEFEKPVRFKLSLGGRNPRGAELWCWHDGKQSKIQKFDIEEQDGRFWVAFESTKFSIYEIRGVYYTIDDREITKNDSGSFTVKIKEDLTGMEEIRVKSKLLKSILSSGSKVYIVDDKKIPFEIIKSSVDKDSDLITLEFKEIWPDDFEQNEEFEMITRSDRDEWPGDSDEINQDENGEIITPETKEGLPEDTIEAEQEEVNKTMDQVTDNFKTGDTNNIMFLITLMFLALALGSLTVRKRKFEK